MAVNQKGANGIIAEYKCAASLNMELRSRGIKVLADQKRLDELLASAIERVADELTEEQLKRALRQGEALGNYITNQLFDEPETLGLEIDSSVGSYAISVSPVGSQTNSGDPTDLRIHLKGRHSHELAISLKAYKGPQSSLGSKSGRASLGQLFLSAERILSHEFRSHFGKPAEEYESVLSMFKSAAEEFYATDASKEFLDAYEARKGTRKVNNPLRRKEVGDFFAAKFGFVSEHRLAQLYCDCYDIGISKLGSQTDSQQNFVSSLRFILGNPDMLVLDAKDTSGEIVVMNSLTNSTYRELNAVLRVPMTMELRSKSKRSIINVKLSRSGHDFSRLNLAMWKDGTIQFKLDTSD